MSYTSNNMGVVHVPYFQTRIKLFCALLSLPVPPNVANPAGEDVRQRILEQQVLLKLLLVGYQKSGTSTIYKQVNISWRQLISISLSPIFDGCKQNLLLMTTMVP